MSFSDRMRRIMVEDQPEIIPESSTAEQIIRNAGQNPRTRALVKAHPDGSTTLYKPHDRPVLRDGDRFETQVQVKGG